MRLLSGLARRERKVDDPPGAVKRLLGGPGGTHDPPNFALCLAHKAVSLAVALGREHKVPMRVANMVLEEMTEALNRGWAERDSRVAMLLQEERAGVEIKVPEAAIKAVLDEEKKG